MRTRTAWTVGLGLLALVLVSGCQEQRQEPIAQAPVQEPVPEPFPESQVPAPEPQPVRAETPAPAPQPAPAVDTSLTEAEATQPPPRQQPPQNYAPAAPQRASRTYVVQKNDTLQKISQKYYGTTKNWRRIFDANRKAIGSDPNKIKPGTRLVIP
ncbi:MAG: LysM peptidoglycan-binding domain-containing protein [Phycisphaerae bacterium]|nr:LysM peptidoglycan-binding domain-containing protein [Phycisphaerae bacterium]